MSLIKLVGDKVEVVTSKEDFAAIERWLIAKDWKFIRDFTYLGYTATSDCFSFHDKDKAMLFKLTFGG